MGLGAALFLRVFMAMATYWWWIVGLHLVQGLNHACMAAKRKLVISWISGEALEAAMEVCSQHFLLLPPSLPPSPALPRMHSLSPPDALHSESSLLF